MNSTAAGTVPHFKLKSPQDWFADPGSRALLEAALAGDAAQVRQLVASGADPNAEGPAGHPNRIRLLHYAIAAENAEAVRLLVGAGADPELTTRGSGRPLLFAMTLDKVSMLALLLELRPVASLGQASLESLVFRAIDLPRPRCLQLLLQKGVPIDLPDAAGNTALMMAMAAEDYDLATWLVQQGAAVVREPTVAGITPANSLQFHLGKFKPGTPTHDKLLRLKQLMASKGAVFPAPTPQEVRASRQAR